MSELFTADLILQLLEVFRPVGFREAQSFVGYQFIGY